MQYYSSECPVLGATDGVSYEIAVAGCHFGCRGCQNPDLQNFNAGSVLEGEVLQHLLEDIHKYYDKQMIDNIDLVGGEPLDQSGLSDFLKLIRKEFPKLKIWIYTGYEKEKIPDSLLGLSDYIKCGQYIESWRNDEGFRSEFGPILATSNQYIIKCSKELEGRHSKCLS